MNQTEPKEEYGYDLFPERNAGTYDKGSIGQSLFTFHHKCQVMLQFAMETSKCSSHSATLSKQVSCKYRRWIEYSSGVATSKAYSILSLSPSAYVISSEQDFHVLQIFPPAI